MDFQTLQIAAAAALALGYGGYKVASTRGLRLPGLTPAGSPRLAPPRPAAASC